MKKLFYVLTLLSVSLFITSCGETKEDTTLPATEIDLASLDSLVGDYTVDNYSITFKTIAADDSEIRSITVTEDNYTLVQGVWSDAALIKSGNDLTVVALISNDSIISKVATTYLDANALSSYPSFYNIFVNIKASPTLVGDKLGDVDTINYEITKLAEKQIKVTYKASKEDTTTGTTITHSEEGSITLSKTSDAPTTVPTEKESLYTTNLINDANILTAPVGRYAISKYEYITAIDTDTDLIISANPSIATERNLIGGLAVYLDSVQGENIYISMDISMQTDKTNGFGIDLDDSNNINNQYMYKHLNINVGPLVEEHQLNIPAILTALGASINTDGKSMTFKLTNDQEYIKHDLQLGAGDSITFTLQMMNDGFYYDGSFHTFENKRFFTVP